MSPPPPSPIARATPADPATLGRWRARLDALTRWCLSDAGLTPSAAAVAAASRPTLGDLLRRALAAGGDGPIDLLDALDAPEEPTHRARLTRVLGGDVLLVVATAHDGAVVRAEARAARTLDEAVALLGAFLGGAVAPWMTAAGAHVRDAIAGPLLAEPLDGAEAPRVHAALTRLLGDPSVESTLVLPLLALDAPPSQPAPALEPPTMLGMPAAGTPAPVVLGGVLRPGAAFLDVPAIGPYVPERGADADDADALDEIDDADDAVDAEALDGASDLDADTLPDVVLVEPAPPAFVRAAAAPDEDDAPEPPAEPASAVLDRLRARRAPADRVSAVVASDDGVAEHIADAAPWLAEASEQELRALARAGWSGDVAIELALASDDPEVEDVARQARRHEAELVVEIDADAAIAWLRRHRPDTAERLAAVL